jgi:hypothetical protein
VAKVSYGAFVLTVVVIMLAILGRMFVAKVPADKIGVRTQEFAFFGKKGIVAHDYDSPGWYRNIWLVDRWYFFDRRVQSLRMLLPVGSPVKGEEAPALRVKSDDGSDVTVNLRVKFRIRHGEGHLLLAKLGSNEDRYKRLVANESTDACRIEFGKIRTEDFYNPTEREKVATKVHKRLQSKLKERHIEVVDILISQITFDPQYEQKIKSKKLADQDVLVSNSRGIAERFKGDTQVVKAETQAKLKKIKAEEQLAEAKLRGTNSVVVTEILEDAKAFAVKRRADAELLLQNSKAEADLLIKRAEADGEKARVKAMIGGGGRIMVALEAARNLKIRKVDFSSLGTDILDVEGMAHKLGVPRTP